jgi:flagellar M-ring protein FliF
VVNALTGFWNGLDGRRRGVLVGGALALVVVVAMLARSVTAPSYALLYAGLDPAAAGDVITAIEARGIPYRVQGDAIHVDQRERDTLRMALAGEGLPANGAAGYELLDQLSGFGTTSQMFDAAYWRAKEGELARTITASPHIRAARVHLANPGSDPFQPAQDVTASVALRPAAGGLGPGHARALRFLVASAVPGLLPENVTILDADSGQVLGGQDTLTPTADAAARAEDLRRNIERLLAARVGPGNAVVQVNVALDTTRETIRERRIDPDSRVAITTETDETSSTSRDAASGGVTVASNLPEGDGAAGDGESSAQQAETRERMTFDMSETQREIAREPGDIRRVSVAVLLNGLRVVGADGIARIEPRPEEEIAALQALVQSTVGFDASRGDTVTIQSMAFDERVVAELAEPGFADRMSLDLGRVLQTLVLAAAALFIAFGLLRPLLRRDPELAMLNQTTAPGLPPMEAAGGPLRAGLALSPPAQALASLDPNAARAAPPALTSDGMVAPTTALAPALAAPDASGVTPTADPVERLRRLIEEREEETVEILRGWMEQDDEVRP